MSNLTITVPFARRHFTPEIKLRGGKFNPATKSWSVPDNTDNRELAELIQRPITGPTPEERVTNIAATTVELLNSIKYRNYRLVESGNRIVIESETLNNAKGAK